MTQLPSFSCGNNHACFVLAFIGGPVCGETECGPGDSDHAVERMTRNGGLG